MAIPADRALSPNFTLYEMATTNHRSLWAQNLIEAAQPPNLAKLEEVAAVLLQSIRDRFGAPVIVNSGYRGPTLNTAIGGSKTSQHMKAEAADIRVVGVALQVVFDWIRGPSLLPFGQVILEGAEPGLPTWIHISLGAPYRPASKSGQAMTWDRTNGYRRVY